MTTLLELLTDRRERGEANELAAALQGAPPIAIAPVAMTLAATGEPVTSPADRKAAIERIKAGEHLELRVDAITYIQEEGAPNRNFIRFPHKASVLKRIARSGKGGVFLRDHVQWSSVARGGTIAESKLETVSGVDGPVWQFAQTLLVTAEWAVLGFLDGTLDRFSIGWWPTGPIEYSHNGEEIRGWPEWWPGDVLEDGTVVEWVFSDAELIETSGVNVPAVVGTRIRDVVQAALSSAGLAPNPNPRPTTPQKRDDMSSLKVALVGVLALAESASDDDVLGAVRALKAREDETSKAKAELDLALAEARNDRIAAALDTAIGEGRVAAADRDLYEEFGRTHGADKLRERLATREPDKHGPRATPSTKLSREPAPADPALPGADAVGDQVLKATLASPTILEYCRQTGRTPEQVASTTRRNPYLTSLLEAKGQA